MESLKKETSEQYVFESFLPYRGSLFLARWVQGLIVLQRAIDRGGPIAENFCWGAGMAARHLAPQIRIAGQSEEEFLETAEREERDAGLSAEELLGRLEVEAEGLRDKIDSGEIDIWDDTPVWVSRGEVEDFITRSLDFLEAKICPACNGSTSLLERLIPLAVSGLRRKEVNRQIYAILLMWDYARMHYEGEPPYRIVFSEQVADVLGIDPQLESAKMQKMGPLRKSESRRLRTARRLVLKGSDIISTSELAFLVDTLGLDQSICRYSLIP